MSIRNLIFAAWFALHGPVLLWLSGSAMVGLGLWQSSQTLTAFGAVAVIAGILLPRLEGAFELGVQGIKGSLSTEFLGQVALSGARRGLGPAKVEELLDQAQEELAAGAVQLIEGQAEPPSRTPSPPAIGAASQRMATELADRFVENAVQFEEEVHRSLLQISEPRSWAVEREPESMVSSPRRADFLVEGNGRRVLVDAYFTRNPRAFERPSGRFATHLYREHAMLHDYDASAALVVVPSGSTVIEDAVPKVKVTTLRELPTKLVEILDGPAANHA